MGSIANKLQAVGCAVLGLLAVVVVLVVGLALLAIGDRGGSTAGSGGGSGVLDKPPTIACEVGDPCDLGEPTVTVTRAEATGFVATRHGDYEGNYVVVEFEYTYRGTQPAMVKRYSWKLEDGQGRSYDYASTENRELEAMDMNPGTKRLGAMVFEVAPDAEDFTLIVNDLILPQASKKAEVDL